MKHIFKLTLLLLCGVCLFTACDDDRDSNPTLAQPTSFTLNSPSYAQSLVDLATTTSHSHGHSQTMAASPWQQYILHKYHSQAASTHHMLRNLPTRVVKLFAITLN